MDVITSIIKCGVKLLIHSRTSTVASNKFENWWVIPSPTLLSMWLLIHAGLELIHVSKRGFKNIWNDGVHEDTFAMLKISKFFRYITIQKISLDLIQNYFTW